MRTLLALPALYAGMALSTSAQTFTTLHKFNMTDGLQPYAGLTQATNGDLYGTTSGGGANGNGTVFRISPSGKLETIYSFCPLVNCADGLGPANGLVEGADGYLYGTTPAGGHTGYGTLFKMTLGGTLTTLYSFCAMPGCPDGEDPNSTLLQAADGNFYGTTAGGGAHNLGTVFQLTPSGTLTTLCVFGAAGCGNGAYPNGALVQAAGDFYGTTIAGGAHAGGTVFKFAAGTFTTLYSFCSLANCADGMNPAGLMVGTDGNLYGTTTLGGTSTGSGQGTVFKITPTGTLTTFYSFCAQPNCADGSQPFAGLIQATDGNFYGTTYSGGANNLGTVFEITPSGVLTTLHSFCPMAKCTDGLYPEAPLVQDTNGALYGSTAFSAAYPGAYGTLFSLSVGLGPFVRVSPGFGKVGVTVKILGNKLTGTTSVTFNGVAASFTVLSSSLITAIVPTGATSGTVQVVAPSGTLSSSVPFQVSE